MLERAQSEELNKILGKKYKNIGLLKVLRFCVFTSKTFKLKPKK